MNRPYRFGIIICIVAAVAFAKPLPAFGQTVTYVTEMTCTNLDDAAAQMSIIFYAENSGTTTYSYEDPNLLAAGRSVIYLLPSGYGVPTSFTGSAFVSSDKKIACSQKTQRNDGSVGTQSVPARIGEANGLNVYAESSNTLYAPQVMRNFYNVWNSYISVQNTGLTAATVTITYRRRNGNLTPAIPTETFTIPPQSTHVFNQATNSNLPTDDNSGFSGSAKITTGSANDRIAASVTFYNIASSYDTSQFQSYNAFRSGATKLIVPRFVRNFYGYNSGITIQNLNNNAITVYIAFTFPSGTYNVTRNLVAGQLFSGYASGIPELALVDNASEGLRVGSAVVTTSGGPVVAIINEDNRGYCTPANVCSSIPANQVGYGSTYSAFLDDGVATSKVVFPKIPKNLATYFAGGWQISNLTSTGSTCTITYGNVTAANQSLSLSGNGTLSIYLPNVPGLPDGFNDAVTASCPGTQIQGISNSSGRITTIGTYWGDSFITANGISK
jgi:hypothetical protein